MGDAGVTQPPAVTARWLGAACTPPEGGEAGMSLLMSSLELGKCEYVWKRRAEIASLKEKRMKITRKKTPPDFAAAGSSERTQPGAQCPLPRIGCRRGAQLRALRNAALQWGERKASPCLCPNECLLFHVGRSQSSASCSIPWKLLIQTAL